MIEIGACADVRDWERGARPDNEKSLGPNPILSETTIFAQIVVDEQRETLIQFNLLMAP